MGNDSINFINERLELIILPTEKCNNRCLYCNQKFEKGRMSSETIAAIKNLVDARAKELEELTIQWFGGEPLFAYDIVTDIMRHILQLKAEGYGFALASTMTTNAELLSSDRLAELVSLGVKDFQITLDGDKEEHDKLRVRIDGSGTFTSIWENLVAAHKTNLEFNATIRLHVNSNNVESMKSLLNRIAMDIGPDGRFNIFVRFLERFGGPNDDKLPISENLGAIAELKSFATSLGLKTFGLDLYKEGLEMVCYAAKPYAYVVRSDGSLSKCTVGLYHDHNMIGKLLRDGSMEIDQQKAESWMRGLSSGNAEELSCPARNFPKGQQANRLEAYKKKLNIIQ